MASKRSFLRGRIVDGRSRLCKENLELSPDKINSGGAADLLLAFKPDGTVTAITQASLTAAAEEAAAETGALTEAEVLALFQGCGANIVNEAELVKPFTETNETVVICENYQKIVATEYMIDSGSELCIEAGGELVVLA